MPNKNIYLIVTGANQSRNLDTIVKPLVNFPFNVYIFPTDNCQKIVNLHDLNLNAPIIDSNYNKAINPLPLEDIVVVAPCTFNTLSKISGGIADTYQMSILHRALGRGTKTIIAAAMDENFWNHFKTKESINVIDKHLPNVQIIWPEFIYDDNASLEKITMSPAAKITDIIINNFAKLRYEHESLPISKEYDAIIDDNFEEFCKLGEMLLSDYYLTGTQGFISKRINGLILITSHGSQVGNLSRQDLTLVHKIRYQRKNIMGRI